MTYTLKVPETVSFADLTADSISNEPTKLDPESESCVAAYEFQSDNSDEDGADNDFGSELGLLSPALPPENQLCILTVRN